MKKNEERVGFVDALGMNGEGIIKDKDGTVFVPFCITGEKIKYKILKANSKQAFGKVQEILAPADERIRSKCPVFTKCGGCQLQHIKYPNQLKLKENNVAVCFSKIANLNVKVQPTIKGNEEFRYRNKLQLPVGQVGDKTVIGFYAENSHRIVEIDDCLINAVWTADIISASKKYFSITKEKGYDEITHTGDVREITAKEIKGNLIITVVTLSGKLNNEKLLIDILKEKVKYPFSLFINTNSNKTNVIYGNEFRKIYGVNEYRAEMFGIKYKIGVRSFMQVNTSVCSKLYSAVKEAANVDDNTIVFDAYSGAGLLTAILAVNAKKAIGVEIIKEAVDIANQLAEINGLKDKMFNYCGKCEDILPTLIEQQEENCKKVVVLDPPRKGCDIEVVRAVIKSNADKIIYVSCKPSTLARDVGLIVGSLVEQEGQIVRAKEYINRYNIKSVRTYDMFAQTKHVETLVVLEKENI